MSPSPYINRFLSADTIVPGYANPQNLNRYSYVTNNPLRYTDPTGHVLDDGCRTEGCSLTPLQKAIDAQKQKKHEEEAARRKCAQGKKAHCADDPKEIAVFVGTSLVGAAALETFVLGGGAASALQSGITHVVTACLMNSLCQQLLPKTYHPRLAGQTDTFHNFPRLLDPIIMKHGEKALNSPYINYSIEGTVKIANEGAVKVYEGVYQIGVTIDGWVPTIVHHFFKPE